MSSSSAPLAAVTVAAPPPVVEYLTSFGHPWLTAVSWDPRTEPSGAVAAAQLWVPPYAASGDEDVIRRALAGLAQLRVVQLVTAGVDPWYRLVPADSTTP